MASKKFVIMLLLVSPIGFTVITCSVLIALIVEASVIKFRGTSLWPPAPLQKKYWHLLSEKGRQLTRLLTRNTEPDTAD